MNGAVAPHAGHMKRLVELFDLKQTFNSHGLLWIQLTSHPHEWMIYNRAVNVSLSWFWFQSLSD